MVQGTSRGPAPSRTAVVGRACNVESSPTCIKSPASQRSANTATAGAISGCATQRVCRSPSSVIRWTKPLLRSEERRVGKEGRARGWRGAGAETGRVGGTDADHKQDGE